MHKSVTLLAAAALLAVCLAPAAPQTSAQAPADVNLSIEKYGSVNICSDIVMTTVTSDWFGHERKSVGSATVDVQNNFAATLRGPTSVTLVNGGEYDVDAAITLIGVSEAYYTGTEPDDYMCLDFAVGDHTGETTLQVDIKKIWTVADIADTYEGTVTLELIEQ